MRRKRRKPAANTKAASRKCAANAGNPPQTQKPQDGKRISSLPLLPGPPRPPHRVWGRANGAGAGTVCPQDAGLLCSFGGPRGGWHSRARWQDQQQGH
eukprot:1744004-Lingulodinium_polyedra.AAC.1